jgi:uncharacterized membrane protein HdeD (DUF308 family)
MHDAINMMMTGAIAMASFTAALFFLRFWKTTRDRFFLLFALSFAMQGFSRVLVGVTQNLSENEPYIYFIRLFAFLIILAAIVDKNRRPGKA